VVDVPKSNVVTVVQVLPIVITLGPRLSGIHRAAKPMVVVAERTIALSDEVILVIHVKHHEPIDAAVRAE